MTPRPIDTGSIDPNAAAADDAGIFGLDVSEADASVVLVPVPWEVTTSYRAGTAGGPELIRRASRQVDLLDIELTSFGLVGPWRYGIHMQEPIGRLIELNAEARRLAEPIIARGGDLGRSTELQAQLVQVDLHCDEMNGLVYDEVARLLEAGKLIGVVGGDHSVSFGSIRACAERFPGLGILHIDAHADLRAAYEGFTHSHASIMHNVILGIDGVTELTQVAIRDMCDEERELMARDPRILCCFDHDLRTRRFEGETWQSIAESIVATLPDSVYVSFDIDGLDPSLCPNTGTPVPGGLFFNEATYLLTTLKRVGKRVVGFDLTEVAGPADGSSEWDGNVGARLLYKMIGVMLLTHL